MKRTPIKRKTPLRPGTKRMRASRSTTTPTKAEAAHIEAIKQSGRCVCCMLNVTMGLRRADGEGCDAHHVLIGGRRIGHKATLGLCPWHHRGIYPGIYRGIAAATRAMGPSLAYGSKPFVQVYGTDAALLEVQNMNRM